MYLFCFKPYFCSVLNSIFVLFWRVFCPSLVVESAKLRKCSWHKCQMLPGMKLRRLFLTGNIIQIYQQIYIIYNQIFTNIWHKCQMLPRMKLRRLILNKFNKNVHETFKKYFNKYVSNITSDIPKLLTQMQNVVGNEIVLLFHH